MADIDNTNDPIYQTEALIAEDIDAYLTQHEHKTMLRFITCGSVDDGKSTLIGRLLYDSKMIFEDQLAALETDSKKVGTQGQEIDFALLVDGLAAERERRSEQRVEGAARLLLQVEGRDSADARHGLGSDVPGLGERRHAAL